MFKKIKLFSDILPGFTSLLYTHRLMHVCEPRKVTGGSKAALVVAARSAEELVFTEALCNKTRVPDRCPW